MDSVSKLDIILGVLYLTGAVMLCLVAYQLLIRKYKRNKLEAMNTVTLITSRDNLFSAKTKFLIVTPTPCRVKIELLDAGENHIKTLVDQNIDDEEYPFDFDPAEFKPGKYYLHLSSENAKILRSITLA